MRMFYEIKQDKETIELYRLGYTIPSRLLSIPTDVIRLSKKDLEQWLNDEEEKRTFIIDGVIQKR